MGELNSVETTIIHDFAQKCRQAFIINKDKVLIAKVFIPDTCTQWRKKQKILLIKLTFINSELNYTKIVGFKA